MTSRPGRPLPARPDATSTNTLDSSATGKLIGVTFCRLCHRYSGQPPPTTNPASRSPRPKDGQATQKDTAEGSRQVGTQKKGEEEGKEGAREEHRNTYTPRAIFALTRFFFFQNKCTLSLRLPSVRCCFPTGDRFVGRSATPPSSICRPSASLSKARWQSRPRSVSRLHVYFRVAAKGTFLGFKGERHSISLGSAHRPSSLSFGFFPVLFFSCD